MAAANAFRRPGVDPTPGLFTLWDRPCDGAASVTAAVSRRHERNPVSMCGVLAGSDSGQKHGGGIPQTEIDNRLVGLLVRSLVSHASQVGFESHTSHLRLVVQRFKTPL